MTDITDQDRRDMRDWGHHILDQREKDTTARVRTVARHILATVDAPEPTLVEEIMRLPDYTLSGDHCLNDCHDYSVTLAARVRQIEQERDDLRAEVEHLTDGRTFTAPEGATRPATYLPDPADVKPGEAWLVQVEGKAVAALRIGNGRWVTASGTGFYVWTHGVERLVSSLVPEVTA